MAGKCSLPFFARQCLKEVRKLEKSGKFLNRNAKTFSTKVREKTTALSYFYHVLFYLCGYFILEFTVIEFRVCNLDHQSTSIELYFLFETFRGDLSIHMYENPQEAENAQTVLQLVISSKAEMSPQCMF